MNDGAFARAERFKSFFSIATKRIQNKRRELQSASEEDLFRALALMRAARVGDVNFTAKVTSRFTNLRVFANINSLRIQTVELARACNDRRI